MKIDRTPSKIIQQSLVDLTAIEADPRYVVDVNSWHRPFPSPDGKCHVCLAGAVMAMTYRTQVTTWVHNRSSLFTPDDWRLFSAIENFAAGCVNGGILMLQLPWPVDPAKMHGIWSVPPYAKSPKKFREGLESLGHRLKEIGL